MIAIRCSHNPDCIEVFRTASARSVLREQLELAGWEVTVDRRAPHGVRAICRYHKNSRPSMRGWKMPDRRNRDDDEGSGTLV